MFPQLYDRNVFLQGLVTASLTQTPKGEEPHLPGPLGGEELSFRGFLDPSCTTTPRLKERRGLFFPEGSPLADTDGHPNYQVNLGCTMHSTWCSQVLPED